MNPNNNSNNSNRSPQQQQQQQEQLLQRIDEGVDDEYSDSDEDVHALADRVHLIGEKVSNNYKTTLAERRSQRRQKQFEESLSKGMGDSNNSGSGSSVSKDPLRGRRYVPEQHRKMETEEEAEARLKDRRRKEKLDPEEAALQRRVQDQRERISSRGDLIQRSCDNGVSLATWVRKDRQRLLEEEVSRIAAEQAEAARREQQEKDEAEMQQHMRAAKASMESPGSPERSADGLNAMGAGMHSVATFAEEQPIGLDSAMSHLMDRFRTTSIRSPDVAAVISGLCLPSAVDLVLPDPHRFIESRIGDLLGSRYILKRDVFSATARPDFVGVMGGAPLFRMVPKFNIGAVSQPHSSGIRTILNEVSVEWGGKCCWINLRDDAHIFLNQRSYSLRRAENPAEPVVTTGIRAHRIETMEEKLRREVVAESTRRGGNVIVHRESGSGIVDSQWEAVDEETVTTTEALFKTPRVQNHANYIRLPFSARDIQLHRLDDIFKLCLQYPDDPMIFCCQTGRGRSTFATVIACTVRYYQHGAKGIDSHLTVLDTIGKYNARSLSLLLSMVQVLPEGHKHERRVCLLCQVAGASSNFLDRMFMSFKSDRASGTGRSLLNRYMHLVAFSRYCEEMLTLGKAREPFSSWVTSNNEVSQVIRQVDEFVHEAMKASGEEAGGADPKIVEAASTMLAELKWRQTNEVLTLSSALAPEKERVPEHGHSPVPGVHALRQPDELVPVFAAGYSTGQGIENLLKLIAKNFNWISVIYVVDVRAEPTVYINKNPYTVCDVTTLVEGAPTSSVPMSGARTEELEHRVIHDLRQEVENQGCVVTHRADAGGVVSEERIISVVPPKSSRPTSAASGDILSPSPPSSPTSPRTGTPLNQHRTGTPLNSSVRTGTPLTNNSRTSGVRLETPRAFFESLNELSTSIRYVRVPMPHPDFMDVRACGDLVKQFFRFGDRSGVVILDQDGALRSTLALNIAVLIRASLYRPLQEITSEHDLKLALRGAVPSQQPMLSAAPSSASSSILSTPTTAMPSTATGGGGGKPKPIVTRTFMAEPFYGGEISTVGKDSSEKQAVELLLASQLSQMLAAGTMLGFVEHVVQMCGRGNCWNTLDAAATAKDAWVRATGRERDLWLKRTFSYVNLYLGLLLVSIFVDRTQRNEVDTDYENWLELNSEVSVAIEKAREHPKQGLKFVEPRNLYLDTQVGSVSRRKGNVLTANFGLKADHFPGAIRKNMVPHVPGAPNFRKVSGVNVYGVAIPTVRGVLNVLRMLGAASGPLEPVDPTEPLDPLISTCSPRAALFHPTPDAVATHYTELHPRPRRGRVIWINMREEPILYIGDRPFVFRDLATPYVNVEFTGITTDKVESIEYMLVQDVLAEAAAHNGRFLVHDEVGSGLGGIWEPAKPEQISTVRQLYERAAQAGARVEFVRLPVTDEQAPKVEEFDELVRRLLPVISSSATMDGESLSFIFNCQMGRGRTTTGMVICCFLIGLVRANYYDWLSEVYPDSVLYPPEASDFANGHYRTITALSRILPDYRDAKRRVDLVLEGCNKMQNLRVAIEMFKNQLENSETTEEARSRAFHHGTHYLVRYFYLIVFSSYLHEEFNPQTKNMNSTFKQWLEAHNEVVKAHERPDLK